MSTADNPPLSGSRLSESGQVKSTPAESALLIVCPAVEHVVAAYRCRYDAAARVGVPAHLSVGYPFKSPRTLTDADHDRLAGLFATTSSFTLTFSRTDWFGSDVLYLAPDDSRPVIELIRRVGDAFPEYPIYRGAFDTVVPHLTIGHDTAYPELTSAEAAIRPRLPVTQSVSSVQLWSGPPLASGEGGWHHVVDHLLGTPQQDQSPREHR